MNHRALFGATFVALFAAFPAAANLESLTVTPSQAAVNQNVTIEVVRSGVISCYALVEYGDGNNSGVLQLNDTITQLTHAYSAPGTYTVSADGPGVILDCDNGPVSDTVTISQAPSGGVTAGKAPDRTIGPKKERPSAAVAPDRTIRQAPPQAGIYEEKPLKKLFDTRVLTSRDPAVRVVSCGDDGNVNFCNDEQNFGDACVAPFTAFYPFIQGPPSPEPAIFGAHANCPGAVGYDEGTDVYEIVLANGWFINSVDKQESLSSSDEDVDFPSIPTGQGATSARIEVDWTVSPGDDARYWIRIEVKGPTDTSPF